MLKQIIGKDYRNIHNILCMEEVGGKVKRDAKIFGVTCAENGV